MAKAFNVYQQTKDINGTFETKEDAKEKQNSLQKALRNILNAMNSSHNTMVEWQNKVSVIGMIISVIMIISMVTMIILNNLYMNKLNDSLDNLIVQVEDLKTNVYTLHDTVNVLTEQMKSSSEIIEIEEEINNVEKEIQQSNDNNEPVIVENIEYNFTDINHKSGFTAEEFNVIISKVFNDMNRSDTKLTDIGAGLYTAEQEYNVNGLYLLGIASLESGWGTSKLATKSNNIYGLVGMKFDSVDDCSEYMGRLIRESYIDKGYDTLTKIQSKYCPSGGSKWVSDIKWCANKYITAAQELYSGNN